VGGEEHFQQALNAAAELEAAARRKLDAEWQAHLEEYLREHNLNHTELTEAQWHEIGDEASRWVQQKRRLVR
jgi:tellurite resistance protein